MIIDNVIRIINIHQYNPQLRTKFADLNGEGGFDVGRLRILMLHI